MKNKKLPNNIWLVSFADSRMWRSLWRLKWQAFRFGFKASRTVIINERGLSKDFLLKAKDRLVKGSRGFGYWCWKPQVILQAFKKMPDGDVLLYMDAGCYLNRRGFPRFMEWVEKLDNTDIVAFQCRSLLGTPAFDSMHHFYPEKVWTKGDALEYFGMYRDENVLNSGQIGSTVMLMRKTASMVRFFEEYLRIMLYETHLVDDSPSIMPNHPEFVENRHDQSVFSLLCKKYGYDKSSLSCCEYAPCSYCAPMQFQGDASWAPLNFEGMKHYPILQVRARAVGWRSYIPRFIWRVYHQFCVMTGRCK